MKSKTARRAWLRLRKVRRSRSSHSKVAKNDSAKALSYASPTDPIEGAMPASRHRRPKAKEVYWAESSGRRNTSSWRWTYGATTGLGIGDDREAADAIARPAAGRAAGASTGVLGGDRSGLVERGCRGRGWCVAG